MKELKRIIIEDLDKEHIGLFFECGTIYRLIAQADKEDQTILEEMAGCYNLEQRRITQGK